MLFEGYQRRIAIALMNTPERYENDPKFRDNVQKAVFRQSYVLRRFLQLMVDQIMVRDSNLSYRLATQFSGANEINVAGKSGKLELESKHTVYMQEVLLHVVRPFMVRYGFYSPRLEWDILEQLIMAHASEHRWTVGMEEVKSWILNIRKAIPLAHKLYLDESHYS